MGFDRVLPLREITDGDCQLSECVNHSIVNGQALVSATSQLGLTASLRYARRVGISGNQRDTDDVLGDQLCEKEQALVDSMERARAPRVAIALESRPGEAYAETNE